MRKNNTGQDTKMSKIRNNKAQKRKENNEANLGELYVAIDRTKDHLLISKHEETLRGLIGTASG